MIRRIELGAGAVQLYREAGWRITEFGRPDPGVVTGPCGRCRKPTLRYGPRGRATCLECRDSLGCAGLGGVRRGEAGCGLAGLGTAVSTTKGAPDRPGPPPQGSIA